MRTNLLLRLSFILLFYLTPFFVVNAQIGLKEISLEKQIESSSLVVEGKVISKNSFWNNGDGLIYTANTVEVYKVFKGQSISTIEVVTLGGAVGLRALVVHPSLKLQKGDIGVFALIRSEYSSTNSKGTSTKKQYKPYGSLQGFYKYNLYDDVAVNPFNKKRGIKSSFYNEIMAYTKKAYIQINNFEATNKPLNSEKGVLLPPSGITFSPNTITAGTGDVLTITGSDFGTAQGKVGFGNADDGGATFINALDVQVLTWSNTSITVEVPFNAGTGKILVEDSSTSSAQSANDLTILYSETNVVTDVDGTGPIPLEAYPVQHISTNNSGGYTWQMFTNFNGNALAKASILRAFDSWRCETGVNWVIGSTTTTDAIADDGINVIRFDNGGELPANVLATCNSWYAGCSGATIEWFVEELDIVFDDGIDWNFGPGNTVIFGDYDFESVALHELGHGHQLSHVINTDEVMHYAISFNEDQRVLSAEDIAGANNVQSRSTGSAVCGFSIMTDYTGSCGLSVEDNNLENSISLYPNPTKQQFYIKSTIVNLDKVEIYDVSGRLISQIDISDASRTIPISLIGASKGMYFVNIHSENNYITKKLILD